MKLLGTVNILVGLLTISLCMAQTEQNEDFQRIMEASKLMSQQFGQQNEEQMNAQVQAAQALMDSIMEAQGLQGLFGPTGDETPFDLVTILRETYPEDFGQVTTEQGLQNTIWGKLKSDERKKIVDRLKKANRVPGQGNLLSQYSEMMESMNSPATQFFNNLTMGQGSNSTDMFSIAGLDMSASQVAEEISGMSDERQAFLRLERSKRKVIRTLQAMNAINAPDLEDRQDSDYRTEEASLVKFMTAMNDILYGEFDLETDNEALQQAAQNIFPDDWGKVSKEKEAALYKASSISNEEILNKCSEILRPGDLYLAYSMDILGTYVFSVWLVDGELQIARDKINSILPVVREDIVRLQEQINLGHTDLSYRAKIASKRFLPAAVQQRMKSARHIVLAPDGELWSVPFSALWLDDGYLGHQKPLSYTYALSAIEKSTSDNTGFLAVANPAAFEARDETNEWLYPEWPGSLPGAENEGRYVSELFNGALVVGPMAHEIGIRQQMARARIIHFACHGLSFNESGLLMSSALMLAATPDNTTSRGDGLLKAYEIQSTVPMDADLVVLSACNSGRPRGQKSLGPSGGLGMLGLPLGFRLAGTRSVVAKQWVIDDQYGYEFMKTFYDAHAKGTPIGDALFQAVKRHSQGQRAADWAGYFILGDYR